MHFILQARKRVCKPIPKSIAASKQDVCAINTQRVSIPLLSLCWCN
jgi:hypothetical protein